MWKIILCRLGNMAYCDNENEEMQRLFEKTRIVLYRSSTLSHLYAAKKLIKNYEDLMHKQKNTLVAVENYNELVKLWNIRYKIWKRG